jgi:SAM-dependent methyltransferase
MTAHYDDSSFFYEKYWQGREYENDSELIVLKKILGRRKFHTALDIGGGFGRLTSFLAGYSQKAILIEPSLKQRSLGKKYLSAYKNCSILGNTAQSIKLPAASSDLIILVRVMHHLPDPLPVFAELHRLLEPNGLLVLEFANSLHFKARIRSFLSGHPILLTPVERRSAANIRRHTIPFVNHHPFTVKKQLAKAGFIVTRTYSVSNFRSPFLKRILPLKILLTLEVWAQRALAPLYFGPSIFMVAKRVDKTGNL